MVHELNVRYIPDPAVDVLLESGEIVSLDAYIRQEVASRVPAYIVGDMITDGYFSVRFQSTKAREDALEFITALKPYISAGLVNIHLCRHDEGAACDMPELLDEWGGLTDE